VANASNVVAVVNALRDFVLASTNQSTSGANLPKTQVGGVSTKKDNNQSNFIQTQQTVTPVKVYDPNDPTNQTYVTVQQVTNLTMTNKATGETWTWKAPGGAPG